MKKPATAGFFMGARLRATQDLSRTERNSPQERA
jgi:hypothetical protein